MLNKSKKQIDHLDTEAYKKGWNDWMSHVESGFTTDFANPYKEDTEDFLFYRRGWNDNFYGIK